MLRVGKENLDIFFINRVGVWNFEFLIFGIDDEVVLDSWIVFEVVVFFI